MPPLQMLLSHCIHFLVARLGGASTCGEPPQAIPLMIFMTTQKPSIEFKVKLVWFSCRTSQNLDWIWTVAHHTLSPASFPGLHHFLPHEKLVMCLGMRLHHHCACFLENWSPKCLSKAIGVLWISINPKCWGIPPLLGTLAKQGGASPFMNPQFTFSRVCMPKSDEYVPKTWS